MVNVMLLLQAAVPAVAETASTPWWHTILAVTVPLIGLVLTAFAIPWLRKMAAKAEAEAEVAGVQKGAAVFERVKGFVFRRVSDLIEEEYPKIAAQIVANKLDVRTVKATLYDIGEDLKREAVDYFKGQGLDVVKELGDQALDKLIRSATNVLSPFPGRETAAALLEHNVSDLIVSKGVEWARTSFLPPEPAPGS